MVDAARPTFQPSGAREVQNIAFVTSVRRFGITIGADVMRYRETALYFSHLLFAVSRRHGWVQELRCKNNLLSMQ
jgi:hypothetical protein